MYFVMYAIIILVNTIVFWYLWIKTISLVIMKYIVEYSRYEGIFFFDIGFEIGMHQISLPLTPHSVWRALVRWRGVSDGSFREELLKGRNQAVNEPIGGGIDGEGGEVRAQDSPEPRYPRHRGLWGAGGGRWGEEGGGVIEWSRTSISHHHLVCVPQTRVCLERKQF